MKKYILAWLLGIVMVGAGCNQTNSVSTSPQPSQKPVSLQPLATDTARQVFDKLAEAHRRQDIEAYKKILTKADAAETAKLQAISQETRIAKDIEFISEKIEGNTVVITGRLTSQSDQKRVFGYVFVREDGIWKYDAAASLNRLGK